MPSVIQATVQPWVLPLEIKNISGSAINVFISIFQFLKLLLHEKDFSLRALQAVWVLLMALLFACLRGVVIHLMERIWNQQV